MAVECSDVGSNSSLLLFWFDLSTPGYGLSNKAWRGLGNHVLVNRSVLRQETSRTVCVSNHLGGRSSIIYIYIYIYIEREREREGERERG